MPIYLLMTACVIVACVICNRISNKLGIPMLLAFILLGIFFGSDGVVKIHFDDYAFAEQICSIALIFIMFYGGFGTKWSEAKPVAVKAILLSSLGVIATAAITGLFCHFVLNIDLLESLLIGSVISSTDAASMFSILRAKKLNLRDHTASLLEMESGSNDPWSYMLTMIMLAIMQGGTSTGVGNILYMIFAQVAYALIFGVAIAMASAWILKNVRFTTAGFDAIFVIAIALISYAAPAALGGNGYLSAYIVGIILGNQSIYNKRSLVHFFDGMTGLMQMLIFFSLGLLAFPSQIPGVFLPAIAIALFLTFVARPVAVFAVMGTFRCKLKQQLLVSWAGLRGASSIVFAIMATLHPAHLNNDIFHIVFTIVLFSILFQGTLLPWVARRLKMIDENENVLKTFNDYAEETPVQFVELTVSRNHPWAECAVRDIVLPPDTLIAFLIRAGERMVPKGDTVILSDDVLILSARASTSVEDVLLTEFVIPEHHKWIGKKISEIHLGRNRLIIMIIRGKILIMPTGKTVLEENDVMVIHNA